MQVAASRGQERRCYALSTRARAHTRNAHTARRIRGFTLCCLLAHSLINNNSTAHAFHGIMRRSRCALALEICCSNSIAPTVTVLHSSRDVPQPFCVARVRAIFESSAVRATMSAPHLPPPVRPLRWALQSPVCTATRGTGLRPKRCRRSSLWYHGMIRGATIIWTLSAVSTLSCQRRSVPAVDTQSPKPVYF